MRVMRAMRVKWILLWLSNNRGLVLRWLGYAVGLAFALKVGHAAWVSGLFSSLSFWLLGLCAVFEAACATYLLNQFIAYGNDDYVRELERMRQANRQPRRTMGQKPRVM